jgi:uncharacterized protein YndB with AHSA1/START domain
VTKFNLAADPTKQDIVISRDFDAPPELVFRVCTDPELLPHWWGPRRYTTTVDRMEVRWGGAWRFVQHDDAGNEFAFRGVYHDVMPAQRVVQTFEFEGMPGHVLLETMTFEDLGGGKTRVTNQSVFQSLDDRNGMLSSGMADGAAESWDRLAELVAQATVHA